MFSKALEVYAKIAHHFLFLHLVPELCKDFLVLLGVLIATPEASASGYLNLKLLAIALALVLLSETSKRPNYGLTKQPLPPAKAPVTRVAYNGCLVLAVVIYIAPTQYFVLVVEVKLWSDSWGKQAAYRVVAILVVVRRMARMS